MTLVAARPSSHQLIAEYLSLAQSIAQQVWRTAPHALELDEMRSIAHLGLVQAAERWEPYCVENEFDPARLEYFKPFVARRVHGALIDAIRAADWAKRLLRTRAKALQDAGQATGLSDVELSERTGLTVTEVRATVRDMAQRPVSLEAEEFDPKSDVDVESAVFALAILTSVVDVVRRLTPDQQVVIALRYFQGMHLRQVAQAMGINPSRASQLHADAVLAVHDAMRVAAGEERP